MYMGSCQTRGPFLGTLSNRCGILFGTQKGTIILTTSHMYMYMWILNVAVHVSVYAYVYAFATSSFVAVAARGLMINRRVCNIVSSSFRRAGPSGAQNEARSRVGQWTPGDDGHHRPPDREDVKNTP